MHKTFEQLVNAASESDVESGKNTVTSVLTKLGNRLNIFTPDELVAWYIDEITACTREVTPEVGARIMIGTSAGLMNIIVGLIKEAESRSPSGNKILAYHPESSMSPMVEKSTL